MAVANLVSTKVCFKIYGSLKMTFCYLWNFDFANLRMTLAKKLFGTETSNFQVKFHARVAFHKFCF